MSNILRIRLEKTLTLSNLIHISNALKSPAELIIIQGFSDELFCGGADLKFLLNGDTTSVRRFFETLADVLLQIYKSPAFVVSIAKGKAVGGALGFIACSDFVSSDSSFKWRLAEVSLGFGPYIIGPFLERMVGYRNLLEIAATGRWIDAEESKRLGMLTEQISEEVFLNDWFRQFKKFSKPSIDETIFPSLIDKVTEALQKPDVRTRIASFLAEKEKQQVK